MNPICKTVKAIIALTLITGASAANALVIHDNADLNTSVGGSSLPTGWLASAFNTQFNGVEQCPNGCELDSVRLLFRAFSFSGTPESSAGYTLSIRNDDNDPNNIGPGASDLLVMTTPAQFSDSAQLNVLDDQFRFTAPSALTLEAGIQYWVVLTADSGVTTEWAFGTDNGEWAENSSFFSGSGDTGPFQMKVEALAVSQVPVPGAVWLLGTAMLGLVASRKKLNA